MNNRVVLKGWQMYAAFVTLVVIGFGLLVLGTCVVMSCFAQIHHDWSAMPAFGFWSSMAWLVLVNILGTALLLGNRTSTK